MKGTIRTFILLYWICCAFSLPLHKLIKRNVAQTKRNVDPEILIDLLADLIFESTARGRETITPSDITEYYSREFGYDDYRASQISLRYMGWGDTNHDGVLTKEELKIALRRHDNDF
ncbi:uncharacterized protein LOC134256057 [Saccostrea cucullata]|uniref:uncharacterized protein LOC134256057 n=1 Tax=Saccostrea cuccullata TaxID=36930 RepID=UPI002ED1BB56